MDNRPAPVTLREVARAAGVSTASVSRALARDGVVSAELRLRILAAAKRLGYTPNLAARSLVARRSGLVGVMVDSLAETLVADVVAALECRLGAAGYGLVIVTARDSSWHALTALRELLSRGVEALVLAGRAQGPEVAAELRAARLPWIAMAEDLVGGAFAVDVGHRRGAELAGRYLLDQGHRRIGVVAATPATAAGLADALGGSDLGPFPIAPVPVLDAEAAQAAAWRLLDQTDPPTAVICGNDLYALAAVRACLGRGIAVPSGVSVVGFGDAELARRAVPALTTLRIPAAALGVELAEGLLTQLEGGGTVPPVAAPVKLVVRESTGPAPR